MYMKDYCPVVGSKGHYCHNFTGKVFTMRGREIPCVNGKYEIIKDGIPTFITWEEIFPYVSINKKVIPKVDKSTEEDKKRLTELEASLLKREEEVERKEKALKFKKKR